MYRKVLWGDLLKVLDDTLPRELVDIIGSQAIEHPARVAEAYHAVVKSMSWSKGKSYYINGDGVLEPYGYQSQEIFMKSGVEKSVDRCIKCGMVTISSYYAPGIYSEALVGTCYWSCQTAGCPKKDTLTTVDEEGEECEMKVWLLPTGVKVKTKYDDQWNTHEWYKS